MRPEYKRAAIIICATACILATATTYIDAASINCNTQSALTLEPTVAWATPVAASVSGTSLLLTRAANLETASAGYINKLFRVVNGFRATFSFQTSGGTPEGFAFVFQQSSLQSVGGSSANLGYNFPNNVAIEFDMFTDTTIVDTSGNNHVEVHTVYGTSSNSANNNVAKLATASTDPGVTMSNGQLHSVIINYIPASSASGANGAITVQIDGGTVLSTTIDSDRVAAMFTNGLAWVGFTGSTSATVAADTTISNFQMYTVPVDPAQSYVVSNALSSGQVAANAKSTTAQGTIQLVDKCGSALPISYGSVITASVTTDGTTASATGGTAVTDLGTGRYSIFWWNSAAAIPSTSLKLVLKLSGTNILSSPFTVTVVPGTPYGPTSSVSPAVQTTFTAGTAQNVIVTLKDSLGNPTPMPTGFSILAGFQSAYDTIGTYTTVVSGQPCNFSVPLMSTTAQTGVSVLIRVRDPSVSPDRDVITPQTVNVVAGTAAGAKSTLTGVGLSQATAHTTAALTLSVNDAYGNPVNTNTGVTVVGTLTSSSTPVTTTPLSVAYTSTNQWALSYITDVAGPYTISVTVNGVATQNNGAPTVQPNQVARGDILTAIASGTAASLTTFFIQPYDAYQNARADVNDAGRDFAVKVTTSGYTTDIGCTTQAAPATNAYVSTFTCTFQQGVGYRVDIVPLKAQSYNMSLSVTGGSASKLTNSAFTVKAGNPSATQSSVQGLPATTTAGIKGTFQLTVRDANQNLRVGVDDSSYISQVQLVSGTRLATIGTITSDSNGNYAIEYTCGPVGTYTVGLKISGTSVPTTASPTTTVVPGAMVPSMASITGDGILGGQSLSTANFTVQARDAYANNLVVNTDAFVPQTVRGSSVVDASQCVASGTNTGLYSCSYTVPVYSEATPGFTLNVFGTPNGGARALAGTFDAQSAENADQSLAQASGAGRSTGVSGASTTFTIEDRDINGPKVSSTTIFSVTFTPKFSNPPANTIGPAAVTCPSGGNTCNPKTVTYIPRIAGLYTLRIFAAGIETIESRAANFELKIVPGAVNPAATVLTSLVGSSIVAGSYFNFTATLADLNGNSINTGGVAITFPTRTAATPYTVPTVVDNGDGTYLISTIVTGAGVVSIVPIVGSGNSNGLTVTVTAGSISGTLSSWSTLAVSEIEAGQAIPPLSVTLLDAFGNPVLTAPACAITLTNNPTMQQTFVVSSTGSNIYQATFTPTVADYSRTFSAAIACDGIAISNPVSTQTIQVKPTTVDSTNSAVEALTGPFVAGSLVTFKLRLKDKYGNPWRTFKQAAGSPSRDQLQMSALYSATITWNTARSFSRSVASIAHDDSLPGEGVFTVSFTPKYSSPGPYTFEFAADSVAYVPTGFTSITVVAGAASMPDTKLPVSGLLNDYSAGKYYSAGSAFNVTLQMRDADQNPILTGGIPTTGDDGLLVLFYSKYSTSYCLQGKKDISAGVQNNFTSSFVTDNNDGTYTLTIYTTVAGRFWFDIYYNGLTLINDATCVSIPDMTAFTIAPLDASPAHTRLSSIYNGRAGDSMQFNVTLYDRYDNLALNMAGRVISTGAASLCTVNPNNYPAILLAESAGVVTGPFSSTFTVTFQVNTSSNYVVPVLLDGELAMATAGACPTVYVRPAYISVVKFTSSLNITAGLPSTLILESSDRFGNPVYSSGSTTTIPVFTATFTRLSGSSYVVSGQSVYTGSTSFSQVPMSFDADGTMAVVVSLPADPLDSTSFDQTFQTTIVVEPASCAGSDPTRPYRCESTRECVANYASCPGYTPCAGFICPGTQTCVATFDICDTANICPSGSQFCATGVNTGYCSISQTTSDSSVFTSACPVGTQDNFCLYQGLVNCGRGICRPTLAECPSEKVCPPFTFLCLDGASCATNLTQCPPLPTVTCSAPLPYQCRDSRCVSRAEDCPTEKTCYGTQVLCPDGSCQSDAAKCTETFNCVSNDQVKCPNGECRFRLQDCPSAKTCPIGYAMCENGGCVRDIQLCTTATKCTSGVRCPDGTCRPNRLQCPTLVTCPTAFPVQCFDGSCVRDVARCQAPRQCPTETPILCPDNTCTAYASTCPTTQSCPVATPTLCPDGTCVDTVDSCPLTTSPPTSCPPYRRHRCSDGTCVGDWSYCPTKQVKCFDYAPVLCPDHRCVSSVEMCVAGGSVVCATGMTRCPNGGCAWSRALCPTQVSCGVGYVRGTDGSCKVESLLSNSSTIATVTAGSSPNCPTNQVICPQNHQGFTCANTLADCPQDVTCPKDRPIRCSDASCAMSYEDCYPVEPVTGSTVVCPGSASTSSGTCGASTTCPTYAPIKCWDESCRVLPEDCPPQAKCDTTNYFLCSNGQCTTSPLSCTSGQKCNSNGLTVKCPWALAGVSQCVGNVTQCANLFTDLPQRTCPDSYSRCREGYCSLDSSRCSALTCPSSTPFLCIDGLCARSSSECNAANGCPFHSPVKCGDGSCVAAQSACPTTIAACTDATQTRCADGSCPDVSLTCRTNSTGCDDGSQLCADGQCAVNPASCTDTTDSYNACPAYRPYRCADGFCAMSSYLCPIIPIPTTLAQPATSGGLTRSVRCADGSQQAFAHQCPTIRPCTGTQVRCSNGQCRSASKYCPLANQCALLYPASDLGPAGVRCTTGHCAPSSGACIDETTGCPDVAPYKCSNGKCVIGPSQCPDDLPLLAQPANGCPDETPYKCIDGSCSADLATCPAANGCPATAPYLCANGNCLSTQSCPASVGSSEACANGGIRCPSGLCQTSWAQCTMPNGCPVATPLRCANGACKKTPARGDGDADSCEPTIVCDAATPYKCADNTCVSNSRYCRAVSPCPIIASVACPGYINLCTTIANGTCPAAPTQCPVQAPILCPDGACTTSMAQCSSLTAPACDAGQVRCFDGVCHDKALDCAAVAFNNYQAYSVAGSVQTWSNVLNHGNSTCPSSALTLCPDGSCVQTSAQCGLVPACPTSLPLRCPNGQCVNATTTSCDAIGSCQTGSQRCEDGLCRAQCLPYAGCPLSTPYACYGRKIQCTATQAACVSGSSFAHRRRLFESDSSEAGQEACSENCENMVVAIEQTVQIAGDVDQTIDVSVNAAAVPRTQLVVPAGVFGGAVKQLSIKPVPSVGLSTPTSPTFQSSIDEGPFYFSANVLSTPFAFSTDVATNFLGDVTVLSAIDNMIYDPYTSSGTVSQATVPCEIQGPTFDVTPDASVYVPGGSLKYPCSGSLTLSSTGMVFSMDPTCESINIAGRYTGQGGAVVQAWDGSSSTTCDCFNVTSSTYNKPTTNPPYPPKNLTQPWIRYPTDKLVCFYITRTQTDYTMAVYTDSSRAGAVCPFRGKEANALFYTMTRSSGDGCAGSGVGGNRVMNPQDICLATLNPTYNTWTCLEPDRATRLANPTWSTASGRMQNRVAGRVRTTSNSVLAFAYIPLPAEPVAEEPTCDIWCEYKAVILGVTISFSVFLLCMAYVISRFIRYRRKYKEQQKQMAELRDYAREIDETRGGIGIADMEGDLDMVANPMVIQMKKLDEQLNQVNAQLDTQQERDTRVIEQLQQDRERLAMELQRARAEVAAQQKTSATRMEDIHVSQPHIPTAASSTSGLIPMEMESPQYEDGSSRAQPGQERHGFGQVRRPAKKKDDF